MNVRAREMLSPRAHFRIMRTLTPADCRVTPFPAIFRFCSSRWRPFGWLLATLVVGLLASSAEAATGYFLTEDSKLLTATLSAGEFAPMAEVTVTGIADGETLVGLDIRPQNQRLYALGVSATTNQATLYHLAPETGFAAPVGPVGGIAFTRDGTLPVDFPEPGTRPWDIDFNPVTDRLHVVVGSLSFRVNTNTGGPVDGDHTGDSTGTVAGINPDAAIFGDTLTTGGVAYTNNLPNGSVTTCYTLDPESNALYRQTNAGTFSRVGLVSSSNYLDFSAEGVKFDIPPGINAGSNDAPVTGSGYAVLHFNGAYALYSIDLTTGLATYLATVNHEIVGFAVRTEHGAGIALDRSGANLLRFSTREPGAVTTQALATASLAAGETLVGIAERWRTGQIYGLGIETSQDTGTLYLVDPQTGDLTPVGTPGQVRVYEPLDSVFRLEFPEPATNGYGLDFDPRNDRLRVVTNGRLVYNGELNFRIDPTTGLAVDTMPADPVANPDQYITSPDLFSLPAIAYTNRYGKNGAGTSAATLYALDSTGNQLCTVTSPFGGELTELAPITLAGAPLDIDAFTSLAIPPSVSVATYGATASGEGWFVSTVGGVTGLYRLDLTTGSAAVVGDVGTGSVPLRSLIVNAAPALEVRHSSIVYEDNRNTLNFGFPGVHDGETRILTIRNPGTQALIYNASLTTGEVYSILSGGSGIIPPGGSALLRLLFLPATLGTQTDTLHIFSNDQAIASFDVALTGGATAYLGDDEYSHTGGERRVYVLANDEMSESVVITQVSDPQIVIDGRALIIPAGYSGTFRYATLDGEVPGTGSVYIRPGTPLINPTSFSGLLMAADGAIVGSAKATISKKGVATLSLVGGTAKVSARVTIPEGETTGRVYTSLGFLTLTKNADNTVALSIAALGGEIGGVLRAVQLKTPVAAGKYHIALAGLDPAFPGGGYAIATVSKAGAVAITGLLPDGLAFSAAAQLVENETIPFYSIVTAAKPPAIFAGEVSLADLDASDLTGELAWAKLPQMPKLKGLHLDGTRGSVLLTANGCRFGGLGGMLMGQRNLKVSGGNLALLQEGLVTVSAKGIPSGNLGAVKTWTSTTAGKFSVTLSLPTIDAFKRIKGSGIYLPKAYKAWGYFPGLYQGGRIELELE